MRSHRIVACALIAATALLGGVFAGSAGAGAGSPRTGQQLREALPQPGEAAVSGTTQFVALDGARKVGLALVVHRNGAAVAFLCDGGQNWSWFTGKVRRNRLDLRSARGARLTGRIRGNRVSVRVRGVVASAASADAFAAAANGLFTLRRAQQGAGLTRLVREVNGAELEIGWLTTNGSRILGAGTEGGSVRVTTDTSANDPAENPKEAQPGSDPVPTTLLGGIRCGVIVIKITKIKGSVLNGTGNPSNSANGINALVDRFNQLDCLGEGFAFPQ